MPGYLVSSASSRQHLRAAWCARASTRPIPHSTRRSAPSRPSMPQCWPAAARASDGAAGSDRRPAAQLSHGLQHQGIMSSGEPKRVTRWRSRSRSMHTRLAKVSASQSRPLTRSWTLTTSTPQSSRSPANPPDIAIRVHVDDAAGLMGPRHHAHVGRLDTRTEVLRRQQRPALHPQILREAQPFYTQVNIPPHQRRVEGLDPLDKRSQPGLLIRHIEEQRLIAAELRQRQERMSVAEAPLDQITALAHSRARTMRTDSCCQSCAPHPFWVSGSGGG